MISSASTLYNVDFLVGGMSIYEQSNQDTGQISMGLPAEVCMQEPAGADPGRGWEADGISMYRSL